MRNKENSKELRLVAPVALENGFDSVAKALNKLVDGISLKKKRCLEQILLLD